MQYVAAKMPSSCYRLFLEKTNKKGSLMAKPIVINLSEKERRKRGDLAKSSASHDLRQIV